MDGLTTGVRATVVFREDSGREIFRGDTDATGRLALEIDYRALRPGQSLEAVADDGTLKAVEPVRTGVRGYKLVVTPGGKAPLDLPTDVDECP
jgi:hypothetical protein